MKPCKFGSHRSIEPLGCLPKMAWKLDTLLPIRDNELLIDVETVNLNAASFAQMVTEMKANQEQIVQKVWSIVATRGKMQNPITGSGGTLMGKVRQIGKDHPAKGHLVEGDEICTLVSLTLTPLHIERINSLDIYSGQMDIDGYAILFESGLYTKVPPTIPKKLFLSIFGEAGSTYQSFLLCASGFNVVVVGAVEKIGILSLFAIRSKLGKTGKLVALVFDQRDAERLRRLGIVDEAIAVDLTDILAASQYVEKKLNGKLADLTVDCMSIPGSEMFSILITKDEGTVYFANPATRFTEAGLGAEGIGKATNLIFYRGYLKGHVEFCIKLVEENPTLAQYLEERFKSKFTRGISLEDYDICSHKQLMNPIANEAMKNVVVHSQAMQETVRIARRVAQYNATVLITGESGSGKEVITQIIYQASNRKSKPFLKINCAAIPENLIEAELFGYEKGSFTGALKEGKPGIFEIADQGTLFLDEIGEMTLGAQVKLLRVIQEKEIVRIGGKKPIPVDVRIIAATNRDLSQMVRQGLFRKDLYYRINVINLFIPPLRERREAIPALLDSILYKYNQMHNSDKTISMEACKFLYNYDWPGNIREMENLIQRLIMCIEASELSLEAIKMQLGHQTLLSPDVIVSDILPKQNASEAICEREIFEEAVKQYKSTRELAKALRMSQSTVVRKLKKYQLYLH